MLKTIPSTQARINGLAKTDLSRDQHPLFIPTNRSTVTTLKKLTNVIITAAV
ncbi:MAG: hypothetical protein ACJ0DI_07670 [bacterium]